MESQENVELAQKTSEIKENIEIVQEKDSETKEIDALVQKESETFLDLLGNSQVTKKILKRGEVSAKPRKSNICTLNIKELLADGTIISENQNFVVQVGDMEVVLGVDMALPLMNVGELSEICVDAPFAYGFLGLKNAEGNYTIPADTKLKYEVELLKFEETSPVENMSWDARKEIGNKKRERGNFWFERQEFTFAIENYLRALEYLGEPEDQNIEKAGELLEERVKVYNNLAQTQMKLCDYESALKFTDIVLSNNPNHVKALFRKGKILEAKGKISEAIMFLQKAAKLEVNNQLIQNELLKLILASKRESMNEKILYQKMLGQDKKMDSKGEQNDKKPKSNSKYICGLLIGSISVGAAGIALWKYSDKLTQFKFDIFSN